MEQATAMPGQAALQQALICHKKGDFEQAEALYRSVLERDPQNAQALHLLGVLAHQVGQPAVAVDLIAQAVACNPDAVEFHVHLGNAQQDIGDFDGALHSYDTALQLRPDNANLHYGRGLLYERRGDLRMAVTSYREATRLQPENGDALFNLANALQEQGDLMLAIATYEKALRVQPERSAIHNNLGNALLAQGEYIAAAMAYGTVLTRQPDHAGAHRNLGMALQGQGRITDALDSYRESIRLQPEIAEGYNVLANGLFENGDVIGAIEAYRQALARDPEHVGARTALLHLLQRQCDWTELQPLIDRTIQGVRAHPPELVYPAPLLSVTDSAADQSRCAQAWATSRFGPLASVRDSLHFRFTLGPKERLRIGYLSADFRDHAVASLVVELFEKHNRDRVDVYAYSFGPDDRSALRARIQQGVDHFVEIQDMTAMQASRRIYEDGIDILVDLMAYTQGSRPEIWALHPAPIQVTALAGTTGSEFIDYMITDRFVTPPAMQIHFSEKLAYMPSTFQPNDRQRQISDRTPTRAELGLPQQGFVYCAFNNAFKITPHMFTAWMRILQGTPGSVLWLASSNSVVISNLRREAAARGIDPGRLIFAAMVPDRADHLARYRVADLFLDAFPFGAQTTASDALWAGLPVLTYSGGSFVSRICGSLLNAIDLPELITSSLDEYEEVALRLSHSSHELKAIREKIAVNRDSTPLFDSSAYTRNLEDLYSWMWDERLASRG